MSQDSSTDLPVFGTAEVAGRTTDAGRGRVFPCEACGADFEFSIGQQSLKCPYCGHVKELEIREDAEIRENDFHEMLAHERERHEREAPEDSSPDGQNEVHCESCGGTVVFLGTLTSSECPYCGNPIQREHVHAATRRIAVDGVLPFQIERDEAAQLLSEWVASRWFAPNEFRRRGATGQFNGVYFPYWTFDSVTFNAYIGERGEVYHVTVGQGQNRRVEARVRWYDAAGRFQRFFDDVLVMATRGLPQDLIEALEPWPLEYCLPFNQQVLAGFYARTYDLQLDDGFQIAKGRIDAAIEREVRSRIGGDRQRVHDIKTRYDAITFKHLLLPVWMLAYQYGTETYQVFVNVGTGEVQGQRPYSWVKITLFVLLLTTLIGGIAALSQR